MPSPDFSTVYLLERLCGKCLLEDLQSSNFCCSTNPWSRLSCDVCCGRGAGPVDLLPCLWDILCAALELYSARCWTGWLGMQRKSRRTQWRNDNALRLREVNEPNTTSQTRNVSDNCILRNDTYVRFKNEASPTHINYIHST